MRLYNYLVFHNYGDKIYNTGNMFIPSTEITAHDNARYFTT